MSLKYAFPRFGSERKRLLPFSGESDPAHHVLAGDVLSPESTAPMEAELLAFIQNSSRQALSED